MHRYWYGEAVSLLHRFFFTGVIHIIFPESREQIYVGVVVCFTCFVLLIVSVPYESSICNHAQTAALLQLFITYQSAFLFADAPEPEAAAELRNGMLLIGANSLCFVVVLTAIIRGAWRAQRRAATHRLRYASTGMPVAAKRLARGMDYHLFLSHTWSSGQDQMRIVKQRLLDACPGLQIFLDVDIENLDIGNLEGYIDASDTILVFASAGYFERRNCIRELRRSVQKGKRIIAMLETDTKHGGLTQAQVEDELRRSPHVMSPEEGAKLAHALFLEPPIEWTRLSSFQTVTINLIAQRVVTGEVTGRRSRLYSRSDVTQQRRLLRIPEPHGKKSFHLYVSAHNEGAQQMVKEDVEKAMVEMDRSTSEMHKPGCADLHLVHRILSFFTFFTKRKSASGVRWTSHPVSRFAVL